MLAERTGLEPATPGVTGRYSNQLNYRSKFWWVLTGSNRRHSPCKGDALPAELSTRSWNKIEDMKKPVKTGFFVPCAPWGALVYGILQAFASLKSGHIAGLDLDGFTGTRVASRASRTCFDRERAESNE